MVVQIVEALDMCVGGVLSPMPDPTTALVIAITSPRFHHSSYLAGLATGLTAIPGWLTGLESCRYRFSLTCSASGSSGVHIVNLALSTSDFILV